MILVSSHPDLMPVVEKLHQAGQNIATVHSEFANMLNNVDIPARALTEASVGLEEAAFTAAAKIIAAAEGHRQRNGFSAGPPLDFVNNGLAAYLYPRIAELSKLVMTLDRTRPALCILHNDIEPLHRTIALWGNARGVPCLHVPHAIYQDINRGPAGTDVHDLMTASHLACAGPFQQEWYSVRGEINSRITGLPHFEKWYTWQQDRNRARHLLKVNSSGPVITYCSTWPQHTSKLGMNDEWQDVYRAMLGVAKLTGIELIVKLHPGSGDALAKWHIEEADRAGIVCTMTPHHLELCLTAADVVVAFGGSNVLIDAALLGGRNLITIHGYEADPEIIKADSGNLLDKVMLSLNQPAPDYGRFLSRWQTGGPGASERIAAWALELANG